MPRGIYPRKGKMKKKTVKRKTKIGTRKEKAYNETLDKFSTTSHTASASGQFDAFNPNGGDLGRGTDPVPTEEHRANKSSYMFIQGNRVYVRHLDDITLLNEKVRISNKIQELQQQKDTFESLRWNMYREMEFRKL